MDALASVDTLVVSQKREWGEILSGFETRNRYVILDSTGNELYLAAEHAGSTLGRIFLKSFRPFQMSVYTPDGEEVLRLSRPFRFFFHELTVQDASGAPLGSIRREFSLLRRLYTVSSPSGQEGCELMGPIFRPWTFLIRRNGQEYGRISKKWSGVLKEAFTSADNFGITLPKEWDPRLKAVFLGAVFLIDFVHFEQKNR
jgi:hypothetical protein